MSLQFTGGQAARGVDMRHGWVGGFLGAVLLIGLGCPQLQETFSTPALKGPARLARPLRTLVVRGAEWRFDDSGTDLGDGWRQPGFDDSGWATGTAQLGYGDGDEATILSYGGDPNHKHPTYYLRRSFTLDAPEGVTALTLRLVIDDGAAVYLNGTEVVRLRLPGDTITYDTWATAGPPSENAWEELGIPPALLQTGNNLLAVEVHQSSATSSDVSFDLELNDEQVVAGLAKGPYLQRVAPDSIVVMWETDAAGDSLVEYGEATVGEHQVSDPALVTIHEIELTGLSAGTEYRYRVTTAGNSSGTYTFRTAATDPVAPFHFAVYGDTRTYPGDHLAMASAVLASNPAFVLHSGDLVASGMVYDQWSTQFFDPAAELLANKVVMPSIGNHEHSGSGHFWYPDFFSLDGNEKWYAFAYGCARFVALDTTSTFTTGSTQYNWLVDEMLSSAWQNACWRFVYFHSPPFTAAGHVDDVNVKNHLVPLLEAHGATMVFSGHSHAYERYSKDGIYYIVTGGGGAPLYDPDPDTVEPIREVGAKAHHFLSIDVTPAQVTMTTIRRDGATIDSVIITSGTVAAPVISRIEVADLRHTTARITWLTDVPSDSTVEYGEDTGYGAETVSSAAVTEHSVLLKALVPATTYHFRVTSRSALGRSATSDDRSLTTAANRPPVAVADAVSTGEESPVTISVLLNDSDPDGDTLAVNSVGTPDHGTAVDNGEGTITYTPPSGYGGNAAFSYVVTDGLGGQATGEVSITVNPINDPPVAVDDSQATDEDTAVVVPVLANDSDPDEDPLSLQSVTQPAHGAASNNGNGTVTYTPAENYHGADQFAYTAADGHGGQAAADVTIEVRPVNDPPQTAQDRAETAQDTAVVIAVLANDSDVDGDPLSVTSTTDPADGTAAVNADQTITYTPRSGFGGADSFTYEVSDGHGGVAGATVIVDVASSNRAPVAVDDQATVTFDTPLEIEVLANDSDPDGNPLSVAGVGQPAHGEVTVNAATTVTYEPASGYLGDDNFVYEIGDGNGGVASAQVNVTVQQGNRAPDAVDDHAQGDPGIPVEIAVLTNDTDPDGDVLSIKKIYQPTHGVSRVVRAGVVSYRSEAGYLGFDDFAYVIEDGRGGTAEAKVHLNIGQRRVALSEGCSCATTSSPGSCPFLALGLVLAAWQRKRGGSRVRSDSLSGAQPRNGRRPLPPGTWPR